MTGQFKMGRQAETKTFSVVRKLCQIPTLIPFTFLYLDAEKGITEHMVLPAWLVARLCIFHERGQVAMPRNTSFIMQWLLNFACNEPTEFEVRTAPAKVTVAEKICSPKLSAEALED